ncbi:MAG TPA: nitrophenyl compound nitroreductase subunit ArsF family protein [Bacteroidales bacterium]|nr:nitrophenyl compound nitroreductase subunit ArsF family protein [Bacteroidales bacterium]
MKKFRLMILLLVMISGTTAQSQNKTVTGDNTRVLVYYFHATQRCPTCLAIEENTRKSLQTNFAKEMKEGTIKFLSVNVDEKENSKLAEKYEAGGSALFVTKLDKGKEVKNDITNFAFSYGRSNPVKFMAGVKDEIAKALK